MEAFDSPAFRLEAEKYDEYHGIETAEMASEENMGAPNIQENIGFDELQCDFNRYSAQNVKDMNQVQFSPHFRPLQQIVVYETKSRFYIIGSNLSSNKFQVLKLDRTEPRELVIHEDSHLHSRKEISGILKMIESGNCSKVGQRMGSGVSRKLSAFGIAGFVRFLEGYYVVLITKRRKVAMIGQHCIYKVEDTELCYVPNSDVRMAHADEQRYVRMFLAIDMPSNFYFSYSYDLTNTLQHNLTTPKYVKTKDDKWVHIDAALATDTVPENLSYIGEPNKRYMWNEFLFEPVKNQLKSEWILPIIHGFIDHSNISIHGQPVLLTLIARRSKKYAGTRFLKRGANFEGDVANEVETEQIVSDSSISNLNLGRITSFVQIRGSFPGHWAQDLHPNIVSKPLIYFEKKDPSGRTSGNHFNQLMQKYGTPVVVLNLVKKREKRRQEVLIEEEFAFQTNYLNKFLPTRHKIIYIHFDMASCKKRKDKEVIVALGERAEFGVMKTGIFLNKIPKATVPQCSKEKHPLIESFQSKIESMSEGQEALLQSGVVRINCVDCLDRTNTAQFVVSHCALGLQLHALGYLRTPVIEFNSDCARMLEAMFEDHGDTLALQYGGSQLIHRIKSYRKESKWSSKANDITQTMVRYYSNTLSDAEKQNSINLFLGKFIPQLGKPALWDKDAPAEKYLHFPALFQPYNKKNVLCQIGNHWWDRKLKNVWPYPLLEKEKKCLQLFKQNSSSELQSTNDLTYENFYRTTELTVLNEIFQFRDVSHSVRDYMPNCCTDFSPFVVRQREVRRHEEVMNSSRTSLTSLFSRVGLRNSSGSAAASASSSSTPSTNRNPSMDGASPLSLFTSGKETSDSDEEDESSIEDFEWAGMSQLQVENTPETEKKKREEEKKREMDDVYLEGPEQYKNVFRDEREKLWKPLLEKDDFKEFDEYAELGLFMNCRQSENDIVMMKDKLPRYHEPSEFRWPENFREKAREFFENCFTPQIDESDIKLFEDYILKQHADRYSMGLSWKVL